MTTDTTPRIPVRLDFDTHAAAVSRAVAHLDHAVARQLDDAGIDHRLRELLKLRASQINGCAYCVDMHSKDARVGGETEQRLYALSTWRETPFFDDRERAALAFVETVVHIADTHVPEEAYEAVAARFSPDEVAALLGLVIAVNAWNTIGVTARPWEPGSYDPAPAN